MKIFLLLLTVTLSGVATANSNLNLNNMELETIQKNMSDDSFGEIITPVEMKGHYTGICYQNNSKSFEALFWDEFINVKGIKTELPFSTLQVYDGMDLPHKFDFLLTSSDVSWEFVSSLVEKGLSGTDNNQGQITPPTNLKYLYSSDLQNNTMTFSVKTHYVCDNGICTPPVLFGCAYDYDILGTRIYEGCFRNNDKSVFKKVSDNTLISHRTADGVGVPVNNYTFYLKKISTYCTWKKL